MQKRATNGYFNFTRKERNGTIFLLFIILLIAAVPFVYPIVFKEKIIDKNSFQNDLAVLKTREQDNSKKYYPKNLGRNERENYYQSPERKYNSVSFKGALFYFDPNTISTDEWKKLGVKERTINTILHFISKGGKFRHPEDIKKIWGLHEDEIQRLLPFVKIEAIVPVPELSKPSAVINKNELKRSFEKIDINLADTTDLIKLPGIGSKLSNRIINFREKLGGFYSIEQVAETFGLPDSVFQKIKPSLILNERELKKININTASLDELKQHPYIRYNLANLLVQYRTQHGNFSNVSDIKKIMIVDETLYSRLWAYLSVNN